MDAQTMEIQAFAVRDNHVGDPTVLPQLLAQISAPIASVTADGAYDTRGCRQAITARDAQAIIPVRQGAALWKKNNAATRSRNEIVEATQRLGGEIWKKWSGYHRRSLVETKMRCFKRLGERVSAWGFAAQVAELQVRAAILNRFTQLGRPLTEAVMA